LPRDGLPRDGGAGPGLRRARARYGHLLRPPPEEGWAMTSTPVRWVTGHDLLVHEALMLADDLGEVEVRSACGLSAIPCWESTARDGSAVTCPRCLALPTAEAAT